MKLKYILLVVVMSLLMSYNVQAAELEQNSVTINYRAHVSNLGWMNYTESGIVGTVGKSLPIEAIQINVDSNEKIGIKCQAHVANIGWMNSVSDGTVAGTTGHALSMEAIKISLTGDDAEKYDIFYRTHVANIGWLGWAQNGDAAGSAGYAYAIEALEIKVLPDGQVPNDYNGLKAFMEPYNLYQTAHVSNIGWLNTVGYGGIAGTTGKSQALEAIILKSGLKNVGVAYSAHVSNIGWMEEVSDNNIAGTTGCSLAIEAMKIWLTDENAELYDVYYRAHVANFGWLDWAKNGESAGSAGYAYPMEAIEIRVVDKGEIAPGSTECAYLEKPYEPVESFLWPCPGNYYITSYFGYRNRPTAGASTFHQGIDIDGETGDNIVSTKSGIVTACAYNSIRGNYVEVTHSDGVQTIYMHMSCPAVTVGENVSRGQTIGYVGNTGVSTGSHLHFSLLINGSNVNPLDYVSY